MASPADLVAMLLVLAAIVATINHRFIRLPRAIALLLGSLGVSALITAINPFFTTDLDAWMREVLNAAALPQVLLDIVLGLLLIVLMIVRPNGLLGERRPKIVLGARHSTLAVHKSTVPGAVAGN